MYRVKTFFFFAILIYMAAACGKNNLSDESLLYGKWIKEGNPGDTIRFYRKDGKNIIGRKITFSPLNTNIIENEYRLVSGKLFIGYDIYGILEFLPMESFNWLQTGKKFELNGNERFPFLSSIQPVYVYTRLF